MGAAHDGQLLFVLRGPGGAQFFGARFWGQAQKGTTLKCAHVFLNFDFAVSVRLLVGLVWPISEEGVAVHSNTPIEPCKATDSNKCCFYR